MSCRTVIVRFPALFFAVMSVHYLKHSNLCYKTQCLKNNAIDNVLFSVIHFKLLLVQSVVYKILFPN
jgi:hypothetical protein